MLINLNAIKRKRKFEEILCGIERGREKGYLSPFSLWLYRCAFSCLFRFPYALSANSCSCCSPRCSLDLCCAFPFQLIYGKCAFTAKSPVRAARPVSCITSPPPSLCPRQFPARLAAYNVACNICLLCATAFRLPQATCANGKFLFKLPLNKQLLSASISPSLSISRSLFLSLSKCFLRLLSTPICLIAAAS